MAETDAPGAPQASAEGRQEKINLLEATLFMAAKPLTVEEIQQITSLPTNEIAQLLEEMKGHYDEHGIRVVEHEGGEGKKFFELHIKDEYVKAVEHLAPAADFSRGALQTLSLIAYRAPVKQSEIVQIRGNRGYEHVAELESRGFIRREPKGHTKIIHISKKFMDYFGLSNMKQLKEHYVQLEKMARAKKAQAKAGATEAEREETTE